jgi:quinol monooxygenase YgiN
MAFTQTIEVQAGDEQALRDHVAGWHKEQAGVAPGYQNARILADRSRPGTYLIEVEFTSEEEAARNNERGETAAWARKLEGMVAGEPAYRDLRLVCTTEEV